MAHVRDITPTLLAHLRGEASAVHESETSLGWELFDLSTAEAERMQAMIDDHRRSHSAFNR